MIPKERSKCYNQAHFVKVAIGQFDPKVGDVSKNLEKMIRMIENAQAAAADWILFSELALLGYPPRDLLACEWLIDEQENALKKIQEASLGIGVVVGGVSRNTSGVGKPLFNSAFCFSEKKLLATYHKRLLPSYDVFEEDRFFESGKEKCVFEWKGKRLGIAICEDIWNEKGLIPHTYFQQPIRDYISEKLEGLFVLSASPFELKKPELRKKLLSQVAQKLSCSVYYCNQVAGNDELIFDGGSLALSKTGETLSALPVFEESLHLGKGHANWPACEAQWIFEALKLGIRDYLSKTNQKQIVLGLSGGVDSSVLAVLAVESVGKENVIGLSLPSPYSSNETKSDARILSKNLGIRFWELDISTLFQTFQKTLEPFQLSGLALENIQPRIRMTLLMALTNQLGGVLLNTSNKSEIATGYSTLYGDSAGALAPLGDLTKKQVRLLAEWMNRKAEQIPRSVIIRPPSAELRPGQTDEQTLPPYEILDLLVEEKVVNQKSNEELLQNLPQAEPYLALFESLFSQSEFKRHQFPPVLRISAKSFGPGRRIPIAAKIISDKGLAGAKR